MTQTNQKLIRKAIKLYKVWLFSVAVIGKENVPYLSKNFNIFPSFEKFDDALLKKCNQDLMEKIEEIHSLVFEKMNKSKQIELFKWMEKKYDLLCAEVEKTKLPNLQLCSVKEFESKFSRLKFIIEDYHPSYTKLVIQGFHGMAYRFPEWHFITDLKFYYNLFIDETNSINKTDLDRLSGNLFNPKLYCTEEQQALGRIIIITCFNLLECFINGIALDYINNEKSDPKKIEKLEKKLDKNIPLKQRLGIISSIINGSQILDVNKSPFKELFDIYKPHRDSIIHCNSSEEIYVSNKTKEFFMFEINEDQIKELVTLTEAIICMIWNEVHKQDRPWWFSKKNKEGKYDGSISFLAKKP